MKHLIPAAIAAILLAPAASAATFTGTWGVSGSALADPGLVVRTSAPGGFSFDLADGQTTSFDLFRIWTDEGDVGADDTAPRALDVAFYLGSASGTLGGTTRGHGGFFQWGSVDWSAPLLLDVGSGVLSIALQNATFNGGVLGLWDGAKHGADVSASFSYAERAPAPVPLPAGFGLIALGMGALGLASRRRQPA
ncbi:VPLPA-CTERM sorting domain-containing protein [uncultured Amaricoccus sp.]|uniref:VPLPA-CTERM sorting domain-containing protein n=1 Tax=uncultured Amaricoccus sp. TaxID=339341 RepID=UPI0026117B0B|nr:VPLPA-CTERM sorting domain-containing protein [uncultured Amaricoccus sp.]